MYNCFCNSTINPSLTFYLSIAIKHHGNERSLLHASLCVLRYFFPICLILIPILDFYSLKTNWVSLHIYELEVNLIWVFLIFVLNSPFIISSSSSSHASVPCNFQVDINLRFKNGFLKNTPKLFTFNIFSVRVKQKKA